MCTTFHGHMAYPPRKTYFSSHKHSQEPIRLWWLSGTGVDERRNANYVFACPIAATARIGLSLRPRTHPPGPFSYLERFGSGFKPQNLVVNCGNCATLSVMSAYPTADQIAWAIVQACRETGEDPFKVAGRRVVRSRARHYAIHALVQVFPNIDRSAVGRFVGAPW